MRALNVSAFGLAVWLAASSTAFADVQLTIRDGRVSLIAKDATVRQILTEWARVGQTKVVNVERIPGGPVTLQLTNVTEQQALEVLLRSAGGYMLAPRPIIASNLSRFDRIIVMPASTPPRVAPGGPAPAFQPSAFAPPRTPADDDSDDDRSAPIVAGPPIPNRGVGFNVFPQPQIVNPQLQIPPIVNGAAPALQPPPIGSPSGAAPATAPAGSTPSSPFGGVSVPGMIVPAPTQQQQPGVVPGRAPGSPDG